MFTKFVVSVAVASSTAPGRPRPMAIIIAPGSLECAALAARAPSGISQMLVSARPKNTAAALPRRLCEYRE